MTVRSFAGNLANGVTVIRVGLGITARFYGDRAPSEVKTIRIEQAYACTSNVAGIGTAKSGRISERRSTDEVLMWLLASAARKPYSECYI